MPAWSEYHPEYYRCIGQKDSSRPPTRGGFGFGTGVFGYSPISCLGPGTQLNLVADLKSSFSGVQSSSDMYTTSLNFPVALAWIMAASLLWCRSRPLVSINSACVLWVLLSLEPGGVPMPPGTFSSAKSTNAKTA